jgi:hypothetical protein
LRDFGTFLLIVVAAARFAFYISTISFETKTSEPRKELPRSYSYTLYVDITDINGETQSIESNVVAGDVPLKLSIEGGKTFSTQNWKKLRIRSENLNGQQVSAKGTLKIYQLIEPNRTIKPNPLGKDADYQSMDEFTFVQNFPFEMFDKNKLIPIEDTLNAKNEGQLYLKIHFCLNMYNNKIWQHKSKARGKFHQHSRSSFYAHRSQKLFNLTVFLRFWDLHV